jgi:hypothetical protein
VERAQPESSEKSDALHIQVIPFLTRNTAPTFQKLLGEIKEMIASNVREI